MEEELQALFKNNTWSLVEKLVERVPIGCKWVFKVKRYSDGSIQKHKARLVAKGFNQTTGLDFQETFNPVVKPTTIRVMLSLAVSKGWKMRPFDVNNAFLNGILQEEVYMFQPLCFQSLDNPTHVCRLHKSLYGLKQAPQA